MQITIKGIDVNLNGSLPLTVKDWRLLKARGAGLDVLTKVSSDGYDADERLEKLALIADYVLRKAGTSINIEDMTQDDIATVMTSITESERREKADRPT